MRTRFQPVSAAILALAALVVCGASTTVARADVGSFVFVDPETTPTALPECLPDDVAGIVGSVDGTETTTGHFTSLAAGFHIEGTNTFAYTVSFPDGRYSTGVGRTRFDLNVTESTETTMTATTVEPRTIYSADGAVLENVLIHALTHITFEDTNANGEPDPGEISVSLERFWFTCGS